MAVPFSNTKLRVPKGFQSVLWVLTREALREQPKNIVEFSAGFLQKLLWIRCDTGHDPARHGAHSEDRFYNDYSYKESAAKAGPCTLEEEEKTSDNLASRPAEPSTREDKEDADTRAGRAGPSSKGGEEDINIDLTDQAAEDAALKIQHEFKDFLARKTAQQ